LKNLYIVRHGQTDFNLQGIIQGSGVDMDLNETGKKQAAAFFEAYKDFPFDKVYTSTLKRTKQSVQGFIDKGLPTEALPGLNEISWGDKEGHKITQSEDEYYYYVLRQWQMGNTSLAHNHGESPEQVAERLTLAMDYIMAQPDEKNVLICMHGRAIRILLCLLLNYPLKSMDMFEHQNLCLYKLVHTGCMFSLALTNDTRHLALLS
jgi:broad specificity phosphatase PhoE